MKIRHVALVLLLFTLVACSSTKFVNRTFEARPPEDWTRTELFFGRSKPDGSMVNDIEWKIFSDEVCRTFPDGVTIVPAEGLYAEIAGTGISHREPSRIIILCYPKTDTTAETRIQSICRTYALRFDQESILRSDVPIRATLYATHPIPPTSQPAGTPK